MPVTGTIHQLSASAGGVPKLPIVEATVDTDGLTVDRQADLRAHGGPNRAICLYSIEQIAALQAEGHPIHPGSTGENITTSGFELGAVPLGSRLRLGEAVLIELTTHTSPCWKNARWFTGGDFNRIKQAVCPGWSRVYARVLEGGTLHPGDPIEVISEAAAIRAQRLQPRTFRWKPPAS